MINTKYISYLFLIITTACFGMNQYFDQNIRKELGLTTDIDRIVRLGGGYITIKEKIPYEARLGLCHHYTFAKKMGIVGKTSEAFKNFAGFSESYYAEDQINILEHFNQVKVPQEDDIVIYTLPDGTITHTGSVSKKRIVQSKLMIQSKWGIIPAIFEHALWHVPENYGNRVLFFRPNKTGSELFEAVQEKLKNPALQKKNNELAYTYQQHFLNLASNNYSISLLNNDTFAEEIDDILQRTICVDPNKSNEIGETALMLTAQIGDAISMNVLLNYDVEIDAQDRYGNTALMHAVINGHNIIKDILIDNGADPDIKNNNGLTAKDFAKIHCIKPMYKKGYFI